jgi:ABC-type transporter Mla subunit MlaD
LLDRPWLLVITAGIVLFVVWAVGTRGQPHTVRAEFDEAINLFSGLDVRQDGLDAGKIKKIEIVNGKAIVTLGIDDDVWPLHQGTKAVLRFGSTIGNGTRIMDIVPGPRSAPTIPDGGIIDNADTVETTEFDDMFDVFNKQTRGDLQGMFKGFGDTFEPRQPALADGIKQTAPGLEAVGGLASDLVRDEPALHAFVDNTDAVMATLAAKRDNIADLMRVGAATFNTFATNTRGITGSLDRLPSTLRETRTTLARLDGSVGHLDNLFTDLRPGAQQLGPLADDLRPALANLRATIPVAIQTFRVARTEAPAISRLLTRVQPYSRQLRPTLASLAPMLGCLRPYAPEIAGLASTWTSWNKNYDAVSHVGRLYPNAGPASFTDYPASTKSTDATTLGLSYALLKAPGYSAGTPVYQPQCGITADGTDASKDPEDNAPGGSTG